ncbi:hypothetical protein ACFX11_020067 [Malus domestica]
MLWTFQRQKIESVNDFKNYQLPFEARNKKSADFRSVRDPNPLVSPLIPPCERKYYVEKPCFNFVWSGNGSASNCC